MTSLASSFSKSKVSHPHELYENLLCTKHIVCMETDEAFKSTKGRYFIKRQLSFSFRVTQDTKAKINKKLISHFQINICVVTLSFCPCDCHQSITGRSIYELFLPNNHVSYLAQKSKWQKPLCWQFPFPLGPDTMVTLLSGRGYNPKKVSMSEEVIWIMY